MRASENLPACGEQKCCASPDLFSSQDVTSPAPPSPILQSGSSHEGKHQRVCDTPRRRDYHTLRESQANAKPPQQDESRPSTLNDDHLRPDSTDTTNESNLRFSPKISLTCTEDSYLAGVTGMVRVSTVEGEMVLNPSSWKLAHTFTDLLGRKAQLVSSDLLDPGVNDIGRPHRVVTSEELVQLISHAST
ncbi:uncharacterized protein [Procambarus clarkii]|uniref:uncharacterized protein n=1 Tax=Procambarus clarkii TaxID=6728 RepID=UPI003741FDFC